MQSWIREISHARSAFQGLVEASCNCCSPRDRSRRPIQNFDSGAAAGLCFRFVETTTRDYKLPDSTAGDRSLGLQSQRACALYCPHRRHAASSPPRNRARPSDSSPESLACEDADFVSVKTREDHQGKVPWKAGCADQSLWGRGRFLLRSHCRDRKGLR